MNPHEQLHRRAALRQGLIPLAGGLPAMELVPVSVLATGFEHALADPDASWQYGWSEGHAVLRTWVAARLRARGESVTSDDVIITAGAQQALALATAELCRPSTRVSVGETSYAAAMDVFRLCGATPVESGATGACDLSYVMAGVRNPTGRDGTPPLLQALAGDRPVIVDEAYAQLRFDGRLPARVLDRARERVWLVGTVSKILCPGLRIGWLVPPRRCVAAVLARKQASDLQTGSLVQAVLARALERFDLDAHAARVREAYRERAATMVEALRRYAPSWAFHEPEGGFSVYVTTPEPGDENALLAAAIDGGVSFDPGAIFRAVSLSDDVIRLRLCYSAVNRRDIAEGVRRIADVWKRFTAAGCGRGARAAREWCRPASRTG